MSYEILVVDDEEMVGRIFAQRLRKEIKDGSLTLHFATSAEDALALAEERKSDLVLILTDINMPGMDGLELLRKIRARDATVRMYVVSAYDNDEFRQRAMAMGADGFFPKPLDFVQLKSLLDSL